MCTPSRIVQVKNFKIVVNHVTLWVQKKENVSLLLFTAIVTLQSRIVIKMVANIATILDPGLNSPVLTCDAMRSLWWRLNLPTSRRKVFTVRPIVAPNASKHKFSCLPQILNHSAHGSRKMAFLTNFVHLRIRLAPGGGTPKQIG